MALGLQPGSLAAGYQLPELSSALNLAASVRPQPPLNLVPSGNDSAVAAALPQSMQQDTQAPDMPEGGPLFPSPPRDVPAQTGPSEVPGNVSSPVDLAAMQAPTPGAVPTAPEEAAPQAQEEQFYDFQNSPIQSIGRALGQFAAGYRGDPNTPLAQFQKQKLEQQATAYKEAALQLNIIDQASKMLANAPPDQREAIIQHMAGSAMGKLIPDFTQLMTNISKEDPASIASAMAFLQQSGMSPSALEFMKTQPGLLKNIGAEFAKWKIMQQTPEQIRANAKASALGGKEGGKSPEEIQADAQAQAAGARAGNPPKTPDEIQADAEAQARGAKLGGKTPSELFAEAKARSEGEQAGKPPPKTLAEIANEEEAKARGREAGTTTDTQRNNAIYAARANDAQGILAGVESVGTDWTGGSWTPKFATTTKRLQFEQAKKNFLTAVLRKESGATIQQSEFDMADEQYFPKPNDPKKVIEQKRANRAREIEYLKKSAGNAYKDDPLGMR
jgi:hypothetical protein